jgi:alkanesulfonate monooxygenase SsuD/methylene tetrahydromethanopterin reductase-like flavin-dependent oxidoreductase (luciferase family)
MKVDMLYELDAPKPWPNGQRAIEAQIYREAIEQVQLADKVGFNTVWFVEHHFREQRSHCSAPEVMIGALSQLTRQIRLGFGVVLMPHGFSHPVRVAEKVATADILTGGRLEWGTGRSTPIEQAGFGVPQDETVRRQWVDAVKMVVAAWESEGDTFSWDSEFVTFPARPMHHATRAILPKPHQDPHPPAWTAAVSARSAEAAGKAGMGLLSFAIQQPVEEMAEHIRIYREAIKNPEPLTRIINNKVAAYTLVHCAETEEQAEANGVWDAIWWWYQNYAELALEWDFRELSRADQEKIFPFLKKYADGDFRPKDFNDADMIIVGTPEQCIEKMKRWAAVGVDQLIAYQSFGGMRHEAVLRSIELLGTEVIPALKDVGIDVDAKIAPRGVAGGLGMPATGNIESVRLTPGGIRG